MAGARKNVCNPSQSPEWKTWEEVCPVRKDGGARRDGDQEQSWFRCEADRKLTDLYTNNSRLGTSELLEDSRGGVGLMLFCFCFSRMF